MNVSDEGMTSRRGARGPHFPIADRVTSYVRTVNRHDEGCAAGGACSKEHQAECSLAARGFVTSMEASVRSKDGAASELLKVVRGHRLPWDEDSIEVDRALDWLDS